MDKRKGRKVYSRRKKNIFVEQDNHYEMIIESKDKIHIALIDKDIYNDIKDYKWCLNYYKYVTSDRYYKEKGILFLHQIVLPKKDNLLIDHINRNTLDNRTSNLRYATKQTNSMNSKVKGISYRKDTNKWSAMIVVNGKRICLGCFKEHDDALQVRKNAELKYFNPIIQEVNTNEC